MTISALTICSLNYLARALVLAESYLLHHPDHHFSIVLVDRKDVDVLPEMPNVQFIWA
ncbi:glycosyl transferase, partial [Corallococcus sp. AB049A]